MNLNDIYATEYQREKAKLTEDSIEALKLLREYKSIFGPSSLNGANSVIRLYNAISDPFQKEVLEKLLDAHSYNFAYSLHNTVFLSTMREEDKINYVNRFIDYPGIERIEKSDTQYKIESKLGSVIVTRADSVFKGTKSEKIFEKDLIGNCYARTYDFLKLNKKHYKAVVAYLPNAFVGGHYHAYLESKAHVLDISGNAIYSHDDAKVIMQGEILLKLSLKELEKAYVALRREITSLEKNVDNKLHVLALEHDFKRGAK